MHKDVKSFILNTIKLRASVLIECAYDFMHSHNRRQRELGNPSNKQTKEEVILEFINSQGDRAENIIGRIVCNALFMQTDLDILEEILKYWDDNEFPIEKI